MSRITDVRSRIDSASRRCRPRLERLEDRWVPSTVRKFDFGVAGSPVKSGYTEVTESTNYDTASGFGWLPGGRGVQSRERFLGDSLTRNLNYSPDATFAVDLPNGLHAVTLTAGDYDTLHNQFIFLEGQLVDTFTVQTAQFLTLTYLVNVQDGRLELRLKEQNLKVDDNAVINLLEIDTLVDPIFDITVPQRETVRVPIAPHGLGADLHLVYTVLPDQTTGLRPPGASIDTRTGDFVWTPAAGADKGTYNFSVRVADAADSTRFEVREFAIHLASNLPQLFITAPRNPDAAVGVPYEIAWRLLSAKPTTGYTAMVSYGDGSTEGVTLGPDGRFTISHSYNTEKTKHIFVTVSDPSGNVVATSGDVKVFVLPKGAAGNIGARRLETAAPGKTAAADIEIPKNEKDPTSGGMLDVEFANNGASATDLFIAWYPKAPVDTTRKGTFFDVYLGDDNAVGQVVVKVTLPDKALEGAWGFGYFIPGTNEWVALRNNLKVCTIVPVAGPEPGMTTLVITFHVTNVFKGTVFTVSLATTGDKTSGTVSPPTSSIGDTGGQTRAVSFTSNAAVSLALTASRDNQLSVSSTARGSQAGEAAATAAAAGRAGAALNATSGVGGNRQEASGNGDDLHKDDAASFLRWLQSDEGLLELWLNGIDPGQLIQQLGVSAVVPEGPAPLSVFDTPVAELSAEDVPHDEMAQAEAIEGESWDAPFIGLAFLPVLLSAQTPRRSRGKTAGEGLRWNP